MSSVSGMTNDELWTEIEGEINRTNAWLYVSIILMLFIASQVICCVVGGRIDEMETTMTRRIEKSCSSGRSRNK